MSKTLIFYHDEFVHQFVRRTVPNGFNMVFAMYFRCILLDNEIYATHGLKDIKEDKNNGKNV